MRITLVRKAGFAVPLAALLLAGCDYLPFGYTPIKEIVGAPTAFEGKVVKIRGRVKDITRVPLLELKSFVLHNEGAEITVITDGNLPAVNDTVALKGTVNSAVILGGQSLGLRVQESQRL